MKFEPFTYTHGNQKRFDNFPTETTPQFMEWLGYWVGDGWVQSGYHTGLIVFGGDNDLYQHLIESTTEMFCKPFLRPKWGGGNANELYVCSRIFNEFIRVTLQMNKHELPAWIMECSNSEKAAFLRGWFEADGCAWTNDTKVGLISITMKSPVFAVQCQQLLRDLGISSGCATPVINGVEYKNINIHSASRKDFRERIGFISIRKKRILDEVCRKTGATGPRRSAKTGRFMKGASWVIVGGLRDGVDQEEIKEVEDEF